MMTWDGIEHRRFIRVKVHLRTDILHKDQSIITAYAENISKKGLKISIKQEIPRKTMVDLLIYARQEPIKCKAKVSRVNKIEDPHLEGGVIFDIGFEIVEIAKEDHMLLMNLIAQQKNK